MNLTSSIDVHGMPYMVFNIRRKDEEREAKDSIRNELYKLASLSNVSNCIAILKCLVRFSFELNISFSQVAHNGIRA